MSTYAGFAPNWLYGQLNAGLGIWLSPGSVNGQEFNGQQVMVPKKSTTYIWVDNQGVIHSGAALPGGDTGPIAIVVSATLITGSDFVPSPPYAVATSDGILSITDIRPWAN
jgi:hypothetical protein